MSEAVKVIKVEGYLKNLSEYYDSAIKGYRIYRDITIIDKDNDELFFKTLIIPSRNDESIANGERITFYMTRLKVDGNYLGAIFATDNGKEKRYYKKEAKVAIVDIGNNSTFRGRMYTNYLPAFFILQMLWALPVIAIGLILSIGFDIKGETPAGISLILFVAAFIWMGSPVNDIGRSGYKQAEELLKTDGFTDSDSAKKSNGIDKY